MDPKARPAITGQWFVTATTALAIFTSALSVPADDWKAPRRFIGLNGELGTYEEAQKKLEHLGWQDLELTTEKATRSLKDLYEGQIAWRKALENIEIFFEYSLHRHRQSARVIAQKKQNQAVPDDFAFEAQIAMKDEKRFARIRNTTPSRKPPASLPTSKPKRHPRPDPEFVYAYNGTAMKSFEPFRSIGHIHQAKVDAVESRHAWYFDSISIPTGQGAARQRVSAWYVPIALSLPTVYRVLPALQKVDGFPCHVVTSGPDTLWIDAEHGFSVRRRVWFQMSNLSQPPVLAFVYVNKDIRPCTEDIWLPHECYRIDFGGTLEPANAHGVLTEVHTVSAKEIRVNTVTDDLFELTFPPGTNVQDLVTNKSYLVPHGEHLLDDAIARANPIIDGEVKPFHSGGGFRSIWRQLLILNVAVLIVAGGGVLWRRWQMRIERK
ncbi:MAG TPA: hypothetical protein VG055_02040 [Planctomycetaceae bacterium]|nr:hypothetical protein [Planctomycetaceae bacterium]